jgi:hypothetical protein
MLELRFRRLFLAVGAVVVLLAARESGLDQGLLDEVLQGLADAFVESPEAPE